MSPLFKQRGQWTVEHERWLFNQSIGHHSTPSHRRPCRLHYSERACTRKWWTFAYLLPSHSELCVTPRKGHKITFDMRSWGRWVKSPCAIYKYVFHPPRSLFLSPTVSNVILILSVYLATVFLLNGGWWQRAENKCLSAEWGFQINGMLRLVSRMNAQTGNSFNFKEGWRNGEKYFRNVPRKFGHRKKWMNKWKKERQHWFAYYSNEPHDIPTCYSTFVVVLHGCCCCKWE